MITLGGLLEEWEKVRKVLNPHCKERQQETLEEVPDETNKKEVTYKKVPPECRTCEYRKVSFRDGGRKEFICTNPYAGNYNAHPVGESEYFICFSRGDNGEMVIKTSPRWCPRRFVK